MGFLLSHIRISRLINRSVDTIPLCLPPHTTYFLQPLDVGCFGPLNIAYKIQLEKRNKTGVVNVSKLDFLTLLKNAREEAMTLKNIMSAWEAIGKLSDFYLYAIHSQIQVFILIIVMRL